MLEQHAQAALRTQYPHTRRFEQLIDSINPRIRADGHWPQLAARLAQAATSRPDLPTLVRAAAAAHPLPDELPAAALWWRLSAELTSKATLDTPHTALRPAWITDLHNVFGSAAAEAIIADPAWPGLVSAVNAADPTRWTPADLLNVAAEHLADIDPDHTIPTYQYARAITYTVDLFAGHHDHLDHAIPDHAPLHPEDEEQFPPDPQHPRIDMPATDLSTITEWDPESVAPDPLDEIASTAPTNSAPWTSPTCPVSASSRHDFPMSCSTCTPCEPSTNRPAPTTPGSATAYESATDPPCAKPVPTSAHCATRADTDRPYLLAVQDVVAAVGRRRRRLRRRRLPASNGPANNSTNSTPSLTPIPTTSPPPNSTCAGAPWNCPSMTPAERFQPALHDALAARAAAAGGAEHIISGDDVDKLIADVMGEDDRAVAAARQQCTQLRRDLDRAELTAAAAFAAAEIRSAEHIAAQLDELDTELRVLDAASRYQPQRPSSDRPERRRRPASCRQRQPSPAPPRCPSPSPSSTPHPPTNAPPPYALLHDAATAANRNLLWCSPTQEQADAAVADRLAPTAATVADTHAQIASGQGALAPGTLIVVDDAAEADPAVLADLAERAAAEQSGLILLDTTGPTWPPQPSRQLLGALGSELPWTKTLGAYPRSEVIAGGTPPDLAAALAQSRRLHPSLRDEQLTDRLARGDQLRAKIRAAYKRHIDSSWLRERGPAIEQQTPQLGLNDD